MTDLTLSKHRYLGDGVYASFDGYHTWLRTGSHDSEENKIALEPSVFHELVEYHRFIVGGESGDDNEIADEPTIEQASPGEGPVKP
jgi:hypothetical protein